MAGGSHHITNITPLKIWENLPFYLIFEEPASHQNSYWNAYKIAKEKGDSQKAKKIKQKIILPNKEKIRGFGISQSNADNVARRIALKRAHDIAKKQEIPILEEILNPFSKIGPK